ncbi:hypothetical protein CTI16_10380 [Prevotella intermedia]|uniref:Uncharacterized protein n=1 Tax=Prevotella intermedia TaxID=28131 RepID=A0AAJ3RIE6_PREIN|nr:hypothetical protein CUB95_10555 [Prevotella intermedia]PIK17394.1 hypothetical protein CTI16_10380 [Prevotella intermedia]
MLCKYFSQAQLLHNSLITNTLQNLLFCIPKAALLHGKSVGFALQKSRFRNAKSKLAFFVRIIFTNPKRVPCRTTLMYAANIRTDCRGLIHHIPNTKGRQSEYKECDESLTYIHFISSMQPRLHP